MPWKGYEKVESTRMEFFSGISSCLLITGPSKNHAKQYAMEFCAQSSLPYVGSEAGIHSIIQPSETPDHRWGVSCSVWVSLNSNSIEKTIVKLEKHLFRRIRSSIIPKLDVRVFGWDSIKKDNDIPLSAIKSSDFLSDFGGNYAKILSKFNKKMYCIPCMAGDFLIEDILHVYSGYMGANLFIFFTSLQEALEAEPLLKKLLLSYPSVCQIYGFAASGTKFYSSDNNTLPDALNNFKDPKNQIQSNFLYCPSLKYKLKSVSKVPANVNCIPEVILNGYSVETLKMVLKSIIDFLVNNSAVIKISAGYYNEKLGTFTIKLKDLISLK
ncbi:hypothetical protein [Candidatus Lokiarchaeum ossiferum]|uniref:hypothetical protein n=1 Tax=Candidatus Lokiarchaeum ossiferum TaxID=2951803 RepID=UPI00352FDBB5